MVDFVQPQLFFRTQITFCTLHWRFFKLNSKRAHQVNFRRKSRIFAQLPFFYFSISIQFYFRCFCCFGCCKDTTLINNSAGFTCVVGTGTCFPLITVFVKFSNAGQQPEFTGLLALFCYLLVFPHFAKFAAQFQSKLKWYTQLK